MSRSGYSDDLDFWDLIRYRGQVASAIRGKRGQKLLLELIEAMDAMPEKVLISEDLVDEQGQYCALGVVGAKRGIDLDQIAPEDPECVGAAFDIAYQLAAEIVYVNDEQGRWSETPAERWVRVRNWAVSQIQPVPID